MELKLTLTATAQKLIRKTEFTFSTNADPGMTMPQVGDMMRVTMDRPRPVPLRSPLGLAVVKKRSPSLPSSASGTPGPWSRTLT